MRKALAVSLTLVALWFGALLVLDFALEARQTQGASTRLGESLHATATIDAADLALISGNLTLDGLRVRRDDVVGHLAIDVADIRCELPPLGWALVDGTCRELAVTGTRLDVSAAALFHLENPKRPPIHTEHVVIDDAQLTFAPSAFAPNLGKIAIAIEHAEAGPTTFRTPLSWLFALRELRASIELPAGITLRLHVHDGKLAAAGTLFGASEVEVPLELPAASTAQDAQGEMAMLAETGKKIAAALVEKRATDWLGSQIH